MCDALCVMLNMVFNRHESALRSEFFPEFSLSSAVDALFGSGPSYIIIWFNGAPAGTMGKTFSLCGIGI